MQSFDLNHWQCLWIARQNSRGPKGSPWCTPSEKRLRWPSHWRIDGTELKRVDKRVDVRGKWFHLFQHFVSAIWIEGVAKIKFDYCMAIIHLLHKQPCSMCSSLCSREMHCPNCSFGSEALFQGIGLLCCPTVVGGDSSNLICSLILVTSEVNLGARCGWRM